jgi:hypothetical protein
MDRHQDRHRPLVVQIAPTPPRPIIPAGQFTAIDEQYYRPNEPKPLIAGLGYGAEALRPYNINYGNANLINQAVPLDSTLKVNYGSYIYNQITGTDANHP